MEMELIKYLGSMIGFVFIIWLLQLWLKSNRIKRKQKEKDDEQLEVEKEIHRQALKLNEQKNNPITVQLWQNQSEK